MYHPIDSLPTDDRKVVVFYGNPEIVGVKIRRVSEIILCNVRSCTRPMYWMNVPSREEYRKPNAVLYEQSRTHSRSPNYTGFLDLDGTRYTLAGWASLYPGGEKRISISVRPQTI